MTGHGVVTGGKPERDRTLGLRRPGSLAPPGGQQGPPLAGRAMPEVQRAPSWPWGGAPAVFS